MHHNFSHIVIIILSSSWAQRSFTLSFSERKTSNVQLIYSAAVKIRCYRAKPTRKQVRLYCKFVLYCELLSNLCIRVEIYSQKQLVAQNLDFVLFFINSVIYIFSICLKNTVQFWKSLWFSFAATCLETKSIQRRGLYITKPSRMAF